MKLNGEFHSFVGYNYNMVKSDVNRKIHKLANFLKSDFNEVERFLFPPNLCYNCNTVLITCK